MTDLACEHFVTARAGFRRRLTDQRAERLGRMIGGHAFDDVDMDVPIHGPSCPPMAFHMVYSNARHELTGRCITLQRAAEQAADVKLWAYCYLRRGMKNFLASRVVELTDLSTGEVHDDGLGFFRDHPLLRPLTADTLASMSSELIALQDCRDEIIVLSFVGASDGEFDEAEQDEIVKHVMFRSDEPLKESAIRSRVRNWVPDERAFEAAMRRLCSGEGDAKALMRSMRRVIDADGEVDLEEAAFANYVASALAAAGRL